MNEPSSILVATDHSAPARLAADRAATLAQQFDATLTLMHTLPGGPLAELRHWLGQQPGTGQPSAADAALLQHAGQQLDHLATELATTHPGLRVRRQLTTGSVPDEILRGADETAADLVVLGARGAGVLRRLMLGTTAERLLPQARRPLLIVREAPFEPYRRVLVALDFSPWSLPALALARRLAPQAQPVLLHVYRVPFEERLAFAGIDAAKIGHYRRHLRTTGAQLLQSTAREAGFGPGQYEAVLVEGDAGPGIVAQQHELDCDLVVLGLRGQSAAASATGAAAPSAGSGSVVRHVLAEGATDVLLAVAAPA
jgi:nucleotide-binding universal stress UspA family protein